MEQPPGFERSVKNIKLLCKLNRALYGLKQAPRERGLTKLKNSLLKLRLLSTVSLSANPHSTLKNKTYRTGLIFCEEKKLLIVQHIPALDQTADILTKSPVIASLKQAE